MVDITWNSPPYYIRQAHFDSDRMAGTVPAWKNGSGNQPTTVRTAESALQMGEIKNAPRDVTAPTFSFGEFIDVINPLQHIPVINKFYRNFTGDKISPVAQIAGGALYGGAIGGVASLINAAMQEHGGQDQTNANKSGLIENSTQSNEKREPQEARVQSSDSSDANAYHYRLNS